MGWLGSLSSGCYPLRVNILKKIMQSSRSKLEKPRLFPIYIGTQERERLFLRAEQIARARKETTTKLIVGAVERELLLYQAELASGPAAARIAAHDLAELKVLAMLTPEERREYGL